MRFGLVHRAMTDLLAVLGVLALVTSGELGRTVCAMILVGLALALAVPESWQAKPLLGRVATFAPVALLLAQVARLGWGAPLLQTAVEFAIGLQIVRLATRRGAAQDQQVIVLAWLHLIAGTVLGGGLGYAICLAAFMVVAPGALVLSHLRREVEGNYRQGARDRTGLPVDVPRILRSRRVVGRTFLGITCLLSLPIFLFTALVFILFPRVGLSLLLLNRPAAGRLVGFSDHVDLGGVGSLRSDPTIVLRVEVSGSEPNPPQRLTLYLRGTALDRYDGRGWNRTNVLRGPVEHVGTLVLVERYPLASVDAVMKLDLEPIEPTVIFLPPRTVALRVKPRGEPLFGGGIEVLRGSEGDLLYSGPDQRGIAYEAHLAGPAEATGRRLADRDKPRYLSLPKLPARIGELARDWTRGVADPAEKAAAIERRLRAEYGYDLSSPSGDAADPLDHFLFESKRGHCEYFSTAEAVMLRLVGVPSRVVTGFVGGTYNRFGHYYSVRQADAHSWVEAYADGAGWRRFDPTPPSGALAGVATSGFWATMRDMLEAVGKTWDHRVVRYDLQQQIWLFGGARNRFSRASTVLSARAWKAAPSGRALGVGALVLACAVAAGVAIHRRRIRGERARLRAEGSGAGKGIREATALYVSLDAAMAAVGLGRAPGMPPFKHAQALARTEHPLAAEIEAITDRYQRARFGGEPFEEAERRGLEARVRRVRAYRSAAERR
jgi:transglutaminase-like putative cysteine protease